MTHPNRRTSAAEIEARRRVVASALLGGVDSFTKIAEQLGVSVQTVSRDVTAIEEGWREDAKQDIAAARGRDIKRSERLIAAHWPQATKGHLGATDRVIKLMEYRAKLLGTAAPAKSEVSGADGQPLTIQIQRITREVDA